MLSELPTTIAEDEERFDAAKAAAASAEGDPEGDAARRYALALEYRLGVKRLLRAFADDCDMQSRCSMAS